MSLWQEAPLDLMAQGHLAVTLDGNEQFRSLADFRSYYERLRADPELGLLFDCLRFVEQPLHRDVALNPAVGRLTDWLERRPVIIDESDAELDSFPRAL